MSSYKTEELNKLLKIQASFEIVNIISLSLSILLMIFVGITKLTKYQASQRLSYKLYFFIALGDFLNHAPLAYNYNEQILACQIITNITNWANLFSLSITLIIAFNLHCVFLLNRPDLVKSLKFYLILTSLSTLIICIPFLTLTILYPLKCPYFIQFNYPINIILMYFTFGIFILLPTLYCFYIFIKIIIQLIKVKKQPNQFLPIHRMVLRLVFYPLIPVITLLPYIIIMSYYRNPPTYNLIEWAIFFFEQSIQGTLNFLFFLLDPALPDIFKEFKDRRKNWLNNNNGQFLPTSEVIMLPWINNDIILNCNETGLNNRISKDSRKWLI